MSHCTTSGNSRSKYHGRCGTNLTGKLFSGAHIQDISRTISSMVDTPTRVEHREQRRISESPQLRGDPDDLSISVTSQDFWDHIYRGSSRRCQFTQQFITSPYGPRDLPALDDRRVGTVMSPGQTHLLESIFSLALPNDPPNRISRTLQGYELMEQSKPGDGSDESAELKDVQCSLVGFLSLDPSVESNSMAYVLQAGAIWISHFTFEPLRIAPLARNQVFQFYVFGEEMRQLQFLFSDIVHELIGSAEYDPAESSAFSTIGTILGRRLTEASAYVEVTRSLDKQYAAKAMLCTARASSLSSVLDFMQLAAPVFRRACPDPPEGLVNLPTLFTAAIRDLQNYGIFDVLFGVLTGRPMFFRYAVDFTPEVSESHFLLVDSPGLRSMNGLCEDFGPHVPRQIVDELEQEIKCMTPIVSPSTEPALAIARVAVQQCWFQAAFIYLYMGLCGDRSTHPRVVNVQTQFMRILESVKPRRYSDSFMVLPMIILGLATNDWTERNMIRRRMLGVPECSCPGRMGNDFVRILDRVWSTNRPVVWSDLRQACWEVVGV
ncbi:unnamed protein product [Rhizoctonia solani]|uniref:Fungal-specific transcription factor domain protein n=1 Tax=Rhizoctonia solani TaxID=456999 RepID=A0A8H3E300_9AGAM|nr:unnamed protein product [Rhizoctonia solani]